MNSAFQAVVVAIIFGSIATGTALAQDNAESKTLRPPVVILTDSPLLDVKIGSRPAHKRSDPDDIQSMIRFLL